MRLLRARRFSGRLPQMPEIDRDLTKAGFCAFAFYGQFDPWYHGGAYYPPDVIVTPPPARPVDPPHVEQPIAKPPPATSTAPRPMPSIPSMPRASFRR